MARRIRPIDIAVFGDGEVHSQHDNKEDKESSPIVKGDGPQASYIQTKYFAAVMQTNASLPSLSLPNSLPTRRRASGNSCRRPKKG